MTRGTFCTIRVVRGVKVVGDVDEGSEQSQLLEGVVVHPVVTFHSRLHPHNVPDN